MYIVGGVGGFMLEGQSDGRDGNLAAELFCRLKEGREWGCMNGLHECFGGLRDSQAADHTGQSNGKCQGR